MRSELRDKVAALLMDAIQGPEWRFLQGLIQLGVAFYHIQRDNYRGAMSMFRNGRAKVAPHAPGYCGVELTQFLERIENAAAL